VMLTRQSAAIPRSAAVVDGASSTLYSAGKTLRHMALSSHTSSTGLSSFSRSWRCGTTKRKVIGRASEQGARQLAACPARVAMQRKARPISPRRVSKVAASRREFVLRDPSRPYRQPSSADPRIEAIASESWRIWRNRRRGLL